MYKKHIGKDNGFDWGKFVERLIDFLIIFAGIATFAVMAGIAHW